VQFLSENRVKFGNSLTTSTRRHRLSRGSRSVVPPTLLTLECIPGLIIPMVQSKGSKTLYSGTLARAAAVSPDTITKGELGPGLELTVKGRTSCPKY
jgi:hypothetical protein